MNYPQLKQLVRSASIFPPQTVDPAGTTKGPSSSTGLAIPASASGEMLVLYHVKNAPEVAEEVNPVVDLKVTECATTNGTYTDVPSGSITQIPATVDLESTGLIRVPIQGRLGFLRVEVTTGAGDNGPIVSASLLYGGKQTIP